MGRRAKTKFSGNLGRMLCLGTCVVLGAVLLMVAFRDGIGRSLVSVVQIVKGRHTVAERVAEFGVDVHRRLIPTFEEVGVDYPPDRIVFLGLKEEKRLEVWVDDGRSGLRYLKTYPVLAASGGIGPKLREGDRQVPEGIYEIESLNPNSLYHLSLRIGYPNIFDREKGELDARRNLGSDIMIHGKAASVGCLAMGNEAAEDLFVLVAETGVSNVRVVISPIDFRNRQLPSDIPNLPDWTKELYAEIRGEMEKLNARAR